ncbi:MAG: hypothetical protein WAN47_00980 [Nitrosotalea sp.]
MQKIISLSGLLFLILMPTAFSTVTAQNQIINWQQSTYPPNSTGVVEIVDRDLSLNPMTISTFETSVWSDSDQSGIRLQMVETAPNSGVFTGNVYFSTNYSSSGNRLHVSVGDTVTAEYIDRTLPPPYLSTQQLIFTAKALILPTTNIMSIQTSSPQITDSDGNLISSVKTGQQVQITTKLQNTQDTQPFVYLVQVKDKDDIVVSLSWITGILTAMQSVNASQSWQPDKADTYTIQVFVWNAIRDAVPLSPEQSFQIVVT